uniref:Uncharacterized protein n=1 Tax=Romanomermis culicivorax TaxID=13658 RepID=A0A915IID1_ROMCU
MIYHTPLTTKKIAELKLLSTICIHLQLKLKDEIQRILLPPPTPNPRISQLVQITQPARVVAQVAVQPSIVQRSATQPLPPTNLLPPTLPVDVQPPQFPSTSAPALDHHSHPIGSEPTTHCREQLAQQKAGETAGQTSSQTGATSQPKVISTKSAAPAKQMPPAPQSDSHCSRHKSHHLDDRHPKETKHSPRKDTTSCDSRQHERHHDAPPHCILSEQTPQVHLTGFYEQAYQHHFRCSPPKLTSYISPLQQDAEVQRSLEALKNPPRPIFKVLLLPAPPMNMEQATSTAALLPPMTTSLPLTARTSAPTTTVLTTALLPPTASTSIQSTTPPQPSLVITTHPVLGAAPAADAALHFEPRLPSEATALPNYIRFRAMDTPHSIMLAMLGFPPCVDLSVEFFSP